jgi:hypothetical protein
MKRNLQLGRIVAVALAFGASAPVFAQREWNDGETSREDVREQRRQEREEREDRGRDDSGQSQGGERARDDGYEVQRAQERDQERERAREEAGRMQVQRDAERQEADRQRSERQAQREQIEASARERQAQQLEEQRQRQQPQQPQQPWNEPQRDAREQPMRGIGVDRGNDPRREQRDQVERREDLDRRQRQVEQERYQVERGTDRERYDATRDGRYDGRGDGGRDERYGSRGRDDDRGNDRGNDRGGWNDRSSSGREVRRLSDRDRQRLIVDQRNHATRYREGIGDRLEQDRRRSDSLRHRRDRQYRYQQRYWDRQRDFYVSWSSRRYDYDRDPFFYTAPSYRYWRGGRSYQINSYAAEVLQQAIRLGYEEGFYAGEADRYDGWRGGYRDNYVYQDANLGYDGYYVSQSEYNWYFREGFRRGYEDGLDQRFRYGYREGRSYSILPAVLGAILVLEAFD